MTIAARLRRSRRFIVGTLLVIGGVAVMAALGAAAQRRRRQPVRAESVVSRAVNRLLHQPSEDVDGAHLDAGDPLALVADAVAPWNGEGGARRGPDGDPAGVGARQGHGGDPAEIGMPGATAGLHLVGGRDAASRVRDVAAGEPGRRGDHETDAAARSALVLGEIPDLRPGRRPDADRDDDGSRAASPDASARRRAPLYVGGAIVLAVLAFVTAAALGGSDDDVEAGADEAASAADDPVIRAESTTSVAPSVDALPPAEVLTAVADRLESAGTFTYQGTVAARDRSAARPGPWLAVNLTVEGEVDLRQALAHEVATSDTGEAVEVTVDGTTVWDREATSVDALAAAEYQPSGSVIAPTGEPRLALAQLPTWLRATVDHGDAARDAEGRRVIQAVLPGSALGATLQSEPPIDATVLLSVAPDGTPVHLELVTTGDPTNPALRLSLDLTALGGPITVVPPG